MGKIQMQNEQELKQRVIELEERLAISEQEARDNKKLFDEAVAQTKRIVEACRIEMHWMREAKNKAIAELAAFKQQTSEAAQ